jgi:hypothetical protein
MPLPSEVCLEKGLGLGFDALMHLFHGLLSRKRKPAVKSLSTGLMARIHYDGNIQSLPLSLKFSH